MKKIIPILLILILFAGSGYTQSTLSSKTDTYTPPRTDTIPIKNIPTCVCTNNIARDGSFLKVQTILGGSDIASSSPTWRPGYGSPQWDRNGCCDSGYVLMWGNKTVGESIVQNNLTIRQGRKYLIKFCGKFPNPPTTINPFVRFRAFNGTGTNPAPYNSLTDVIGISSSITGNWATYALPVWTATADFNSIEINPENNNTQNDGRYVSWGHIDNVCIEEVPACECGKWNGFNFSLRTPIQTDLPPKEGSMVKSILCGQTIVVQQGYLLALNPAFACIGSCRATYKGMLTLPNGAVHTVNNFPYNFTQSVPGYYTLSVNAFCGDKSCGSCTIRIFVTPGCNGDIIRGRIYPDLYTEVSRFDLKIKENLVAMLTIAEEDKQYIDLGSGAFSLRFKSNAATITDAAGKNIASYAQRPGIPGQPNLSCEEQEDQQWEAFNSEVAPGLLAMANNTCKAVTYCLMIYCNGQPTVAYLLIIRPSDRNCRTYKEINRSLLIMLKE